MPLSQTAQALIRYLGREGQERACYEQPLRQALNLSPEAYQAAVDELVDYGLVGPALAESDEAYGCVTLTEEGRQALARDLAPEALPLTPAAVARNPIVAASWAIDRVASGQELPTSRAGLAAEIVRAVRGLLPIVGECLPPTPLETVQAAAEALLAEVQQQEPRTAVIRRALRVMGFPNGASTFNSPLVAALPALAAAIDRLLEAEE